MDMNEVIQISNENIDRFYNDLKKIFDETKYFLENEKGYSLKRDKRVIYNNSTSLDKPSNWFPSYVSMFLMNDNKEAYVVSVMTRNIYDDNLPIDKIKLLLGKIYGINKNDNLKEVCIDTIYNPDWITENKNKNGIQYTYMECVDDEEKNELGYEYGFVIQKELFEIDDFSKWIKSNTDFLDLLNR